jgi:hypothetical protein
VQRYWLAAALAYNLRHEECYELVAKQQQIDPQPFYAKMMLFLQHALQGQSEKIEAILTDDFVQTAWRDLQYSSLVATYYAMLDQKDNALKWLTNSVDRGFINYPFLAKYDPFLSECSEYAPIQKLLRRVKREWENFKV